MTKPRNGSPNKGLEGIKKFALTINDSILQAVDYYRQEIEVSRSEMARRMIDSVRNSMGRARLRAFYYQTWSKLVFDDPQKVVVFEWTEEQDGELLSLAEAVIGRTRASKPNRSEAFRVLAVMFGVERDLLKLKRVERLQLEPAFRSGDLFR